jgi:hypothetical protein
MNDAKNENVLPPDAINDDVITRGEAARPAAEILIAGASDVVRCKDKPARKKNRLVIESINRVATSMLPLSLAT